MKRGALAGDLFAPEVILPVQFFAPRSVERPEKRLMLAVLEDAVLTVHRHVGDKRARARRLVREVEQWMEMRNGDWVFSFENICAALNFNAGAIRRGLQALAQHRSETAAAGVLPFGIGRRVAGERHRVSAPRRHRRTTPVVE